MNATTLDKPFTIALIADVHYGDDHAGSGRRCSIADVLLERAVRRLNRLVRPDVVLVLGDLVDDGGSAEAPGRLAELRMILDGLDAPWLAIPGNHDDDSEQFYSVFPRPAAIEDIGDVRFLAFVDREEPGYNATRSRDDIERIRRARADHDGPIVALQHVCLFPPEQGRVAPYNYTNAGEVITALKEAGVTLSVSGHHHHGAENVRDSGVTFVNTPGLCEAPFPFLAITLDAGRVETQRHELAMPTELQLVDNHIHTQLAYCAENMSVRKSIALARDFGLAGITFTEHAGQLYFDRKPYWANAWMAAGVGGADEDYNRMPAYLELKRANEGDFARFSLEVECDVHGKMVLHREDRHNFDWIMGTIHALSDFSKGTPPQQHHLDEFLHLVDCMGRQGIRVLAHPTRIFRRAGWETPRGLFEPTAALLREYGIAAEINFHTNEPPVEFVRCCLAQGVKFSFGSDSHNLAEIGDFSFHLSLLDDAGFDGDPRDVLVDAPR